MIGLRLGATRFGIAPTSRATRATVVQAPAAAGNADFIRARVAATPPGTRSATHANIGTITSTAITAYPAATAPTLSHIASSRSLNPCRCTGIAFPT